MLQNQNSSTNHYQNEISKVIDYIEENIGSKLLLDELAQVAMFSKYHFHRIFKSVMNEKLNDFIKRTKMIKAYRLLQVNKSQNIKDLAFALGYNSTANFTRDFKKHHGISPTEARNAEPFIEKRTVEQNQKQLKIEFKGIEYLSEKFIVYKKLTTGYDTELIPIAFNELYQLALQHGFKIEQFLGIGYDDPDYTSKDKCIYDACMIVNKAVVPKNITYNTKTIKSGKFAVFNFQGYKDDISLAWDYMFKDWLINSDFIPDDRPHLEMYIPCEGYEQGFFNVNLCLPVVKL